MAREAKAPSDEALRNELEGIWSAVRTAFAKYRLDDALPWLDVPPGAPRPTRDQARMLSEFLPDIRAGRFLSLERAGREGEIAALYRDTGRDAEETAVTVFRFRRAGTGWKICPAPHSCDTVSVPRAEAADPAALRALRPELAAQPES